MRRIERDFIDWQTDERLTDLFRTVKHHWYHRVDWFKLAVWLGLAVFLWIFWYGVAKAL